MTRGARLPERCRPLSPWVLRLSKFTFCGTFLAPSQQHAEFLVWRLDS